MMLLVSGVLILFNILLCTSQPFTSLIDGRTIQTKYQLPTHGDWTFKLKEFRRAKISDSCSYQYSVAANGTIYSRIRAPDFLLCGAPLRTEHIRIFAFNQNLDLKLDLRYALHSDYIPLFSIQLLQATLSTNFESLCISPNDIFTQDQTVRQLLNYYPQSKSDLTTFSELKLCCERSSGESLEQSVSNLTFERSCLHNRAKRNIFANHHDPQFDPASYPIDLNEERDIGTDVVQVTATDQDEGRAAVIKFSLLANVDQRSLGVFQIDPDTGWVSTISRVDREAAGLPVHYFTVKAEDQGTPSRSAEASLTITIIDINDHEPTFDRESYEEEISEAQGLDIPILTLTAHDEDIGLNQEIRYTFINPAIISKFSINSESGAISLVEKLDREDETEYNLFVQASDQASDISGRLSSTVSVHIVVKDENDNEPIFASESYNFTVREDLNVSGGPVLIGLVQATDADEGPNSEIIYSITYGGNGLFRIDPNDGNLTVIAPLDRESMASGAYSLRVKAVDQGTPSNQATVNVKVNIVDVNDNSPIFQFPGSSHEYAYRESEALSVGGIVGTIKATDADSGLNAEIIYSVIPQSELVIPFYINPVTGILTTNATLDRETQSSYDLLVMARDKGVPSRNTTTHVQIAILDINDNPPRFNQTVYEKSIVEDTPVNDPVITLLASDPDENDEVLYSIISGDPSADFLIIPEQRYGEIRVNKQLSFERQTFYSLTVQAVDRSGKSSRCTVNINVLDKNRHKPVFVQSVFEYRVYEDATIGSPIGPPVTANDNDAGANGNISYFLIGQLDLFPFRMNTVTGEILVDGMLDRDNPNTQQFQVEVFAKDHGVDVQFESEIPAEVKITILDVNDNPPHFLNTSYSASVPEDAHESSQVLTVAATDADQPGTVNARINYSFKGNDGNGSFFVEHNTGNIKINSPLDRETTSYYELVVYAMDMNLTSRLSSSVNVYITVLDVNDNAPVFESSPVTRRILENSPPNSFVEPPIRATDADVGANAVIRFSIVSGDTSAFTLVDSGQGSFKLKTAPNTYLDYESLRKNYTLEVQAASLYKISKTTVVVYLQDINDNAPVLQNFSIIVNNYRQKFPQGVIGRVPASDRDESDRGNLRYSITSRNEVNFFQLNNMTGEITLNQELDTDRPTNGTFNVQVRDDLNKVNATCTLHYIPIEDEMIQNSVTLRLYDMTAQKFMSRLYKYTKEALSQVLEVIPDNIFILDIKDDTEVDLSASRPILNISFAALQLIHESRVYLSQEHIQEQIYLRLDLLKNLSTVTVIPFDDTICVIEPCDNYKICSSVREFDLGASFLHTDTMLFRPIRSKLQYACTCHAGYVGMEETWHCDREINLCYSQPCKNGATCLQVERKFTCSCAPGFGGSLCEYNTESEKYNATNVCPQEVCSGTDSHCSGLILGGMACYRGDRCSNTETQTDTCALRSATFRPGSYLMFPSIKVHHRLNVKLSFATRKKDGLLLYNGRYNHRDDFLSLQLINSSVVASISLGSEVYTIAVGSQYGLNDGLWHTIELDYNDWTLTLSLDDCDVGLNLQNPKLNSYPCAARRVLDVRSSCKQTEVVDREIFCSLQVTAPMLIGSLPAYLRISELTTSDFVGCIRDLQMDYKPIDLRLAVTMYNITEGCLYKRDFCANSPCTNQGNCESVWNRFSCTCPDGFGGSDCGRTIAQTYTFMGISYLKYLPATRAIRYPWLNSLIFRTTTSDSLLMKIELNNGKSIEFKISDGMINFIYADYHYVFDETIVNDDKWHEFKVAYLKDSNQMGFINLQLDFPEIQIHKPLDNSLDGLVPNRVWVGGDSQTGLSNREFSGCIKDVRMGDNSLVNPVEHEVTEGCVPQQPCTASCPTATSTCQVDWDSSYCVCKPGYAGSTCENICDSRYNPCQNQASCRLNSTDTKGYTCTCSPSHYGDYCQQTVVSTCAASWWGVPPVCGPCSCDTQLNFDVSCHKLTGKCRCLLGYYQPQGSEACVACSCYATGSTSRDCDETSGQCQCHPGVEGRRCDICPNHFAEVTSMGCTVIYSSCPLSYSEGILWPRTEFNRSTVVLCPIGSVGNATRQCQDNKQGWATPNLDGCTTLGFFSLTDLLNDLEARQPRGNSSVPVHGANTESYLFKVKQTIDELHDALVEDGVNYVNDLDMTIRILREVLLREKDNIDRKLTNLQHNNFLPKLINVTSHILDYSLAHFWNKLNTKQRSTAGTDLMDQMELYLANLVHHMAFKPLEMSPEQYVTKNVVFGLDTISEILSNVTIPKYNNNVQNPQSFDTRTAVSLPPRLFDYNRQTGMVTAKAVAGYIIYRDAGKILALQDGLYADNIRPAVRGVLGSTSPLLMLVLQQGDRRVRVPAGSKITLNYQLNDWKDGLNPQCAYLQAGLWSTDGCTLESVSQDKFTCSCTHLSTFSVIINEFNEAAGVISPLGLDVYISVAFSLFCFMLTFLVFICLKDLRSNYIYIQINLMLCWILALLVYISGLNHYESPAGCTVVAILLQFFVLSIFSWMFINALHIHRVLVEKRNVDREAMIVYIIIGYVLPGVITGLSVGLSPDEYGSEYTLLCWLNINKPIIWSMAAPILLYMVGCSVLLMSNCRLLYILEDTKKDYDLFRSAVWIMLILLPLSACTWAFGIMASNIPASGEKHYRYLFSAFVFVTAFVALLVNVLLSKRGRNELKRRVNQCQGQGDFEEDSETSKRLGRFGDYRNNSSLAGGLTQMTLAGGSETSTTTSFTRSSTTTGQDLLGYLRHAHSSASSDIPSASHRRRDRTTTEYSESDTDSEEEEMRAVREKDIELASSHSSDEDDPLPPVRVTSPRAQPNLVQSPLQIETPDPQDTHSTTPHAPTSTNIPVPPYLVNSEPKPFTGTLSVSTHSTLGSRNSGSVRNNGHPQDLHQDQGHTNHAADSNDIFLDQSSDNSNTPHLAPPSTYSTSLLTHGKLLSHQNISEHSDSQPPSQINSLDRQQSSLERQGPLFSGSGRTSLERRQNSMGRRAPAPPPRIDSYSPCADLKGDEERSSEVSLPPPPPAAFSSPPPLQDEAHNETQV